MSNPVAIVEIRADSHGLVANLRDARAKFGQWADGVKDDMGKRLGKTGILDTAVGTALGNIATGGARRALGFFEDMGKSAFTFSEHLTRLQILANETPASMEELAASIRKTSDATGIGQLEILKGAEAYVALTGDMKSARSEASLFARVAQAENASVGDIAQTAAALSQNLHVMPDEMEAAFSALAVQGKLGAIELKDLATQLSTIAPQWAMFQNGTGARGVRELGAALQIVKRGFGGDASETITGLQSLLTALVKHAGTFQAGGIKVFDTDKNGKKQMRDVFSIIEQIGNSKLMKDPTALEKAFGRVEAYRAFLQLQQNEKELRAIADAGADAGVIQRDLDTYMQSAAGKTTQAWTQLKNQVMAAFTPERIQAFSEALVAAVELAANLVSKLEEVAAWIEAHREQTPEQAAAAAAKEAANMTPEQRKSLAASYAAEGAQAAATRSTVLGTIGNLLGFGTAASETDLGQQEISKVATMVGSVSPLLNDPGLTGENQFTAANAITNDKFGNTMAGAAGTVSSNADLKGFAREIGRSLAAELRAMHVSVQVDHKEIARSAATSPTHRQGVAR